MQIPNKTQTEKALAIRCEIKRIRLEIESTPSHDERIALEEEIEDLRQDLIEVLCY